MDTSKDRLEPDPVIEFYKKDIDVTLLRENLKPHGSSRLTQDLDLVYEAIAELEQLDDEI